MFNVKLTIFLIESEIAYFYLRSPPNIHRVITRFEWISHLTLMRLFSSPAGQQPLFFQIIFTEELGFR